MNQSKSKNIGSTRRLIRHPWHSFYSTFNSRSKQDTEQRCELRLNYVISLKNTLELLDPLASTLADATDPLLDSVRQVIPLDEVYLRLTNL